MQTHSFPQPNRIRKLATRVALVLAAACGGNAALAQTDCLTGFNCGRVAYIENRFENPT